MTKFLLAGTAALLLFAPVATAGPVVSSTTWIQLDNTCDYFGLTRHGDVFAEVHGCANLTLGLGAGMAARTKDLGSIVVIADSHKTDQIAQSCYVFQRPFVTGGRWEAYFTSDGRKMVEMGSGTYTVLNGAPPWR